MKAYWQWSLLTTIISYLFISYMQWDIFWIKIIPKIDPPIRFLIFICFIIKELLTIVSYDAVKKTP